MALGVLQAAYDLGLGVPRHVSVTGFDDIFVASLRSVSLTTVRVHWEDIAGLATARLLAKMSTRPDGLPTEHLQLPCELVVRATTSPPHPGV
jgi:DNA-binding LacI/PurR family transcriptional regulator